MPRFLTPIDLTKNELKQAAIQNLASAPGTPATGQIYFDTVAGAIKCHNGTSFKKMLQSGEVVNVDIDAAAAIAYSKLNLATSIVNADIAAGAAIVYSKLSLALSIVNGDISSTAAIAYSKLALSSSIVLGDLAASLKPSGSAADSDEAVRALGSTAGKAMPGVSGLDDIAAANASTGSITASNQKITNLADGTVSGDAVNKGQLDAAVLGLVDYKSSVRAVATSSITLSGLQTIDGVSVVAGNRVLVTAQAASGQDNGIYTASAGTWTRSTDADVSAEVNAGMYLSVEEGTGYRDTVWLLATNDPITLGSTSLSFIQLPTLNDLVAGAGLTKSGSTIDVVGTANRITANANDIDISTAYVGQASITTLGTITTGVWTGTDIAVADGGTGASTASGAKTNLGIMTRFAQDVGNGAATSIAVTHSFGTKDVNVMVFDNSTFEQVFPDVVMTSTSVVTVSFGVAPATDAYRVVVIG